MNVGAIRKPLLIFCLMASIAFHIGAVWFLYFHPFVHETGSDIAGIRPAPTPRIVPKEEESLLIEKIEKALEESLNTIVLTAKSQETQYDIAGEDQAQEDDLQIERVSVVPPKKLFASEPKIREEELVLIVESRAEFFASMPPLFDPDLKASLADFALEEELEDLGEYKSEKYASVDFTGPNISSTHPAASQAIEDDYTMTDEQFSPVALPTHSAVGLDPNFITSLQKLKTSPNEIGRLPTKEKQIPTLHDQASAKLVLPDSVDYLRSQWIKRSLAESTLPDFDYYGLSLVTTGVDYEDDIEVDVTLMPAPDGGGKYVFSLAINPEFEKQCQPMKQNFYFILDRSSTMEKQKYPRFKRAVQRAMAALHEGDSFNILVFDKNVMRLSKKNLPVSPRTIEAAESFLEGQSNKTHTGLTEVFNTLEDVLPTNFDESELHSVILITDGNSILQSQQQKRAVGLWTQKYKGNVNLYAAASGKGNNLVLLDLLSYSTGGKMIYSETNAGFPRRLVRLVKDLHYPLVKNLAIDALPSAPGAQLSLYPHNSYLPPMFAGQPYILTGTIDTLCDLNIVIQGKNNAKSISLQKTISLEDAVRGGRGLEKTWAITQSKICYDQFLKNGKNTHLKEAVQLVAPFKGSIASEQ